MRAPSLAGRSKDPHIRLAQPDTSAQRPKKIKDHKAQTARQELTPKGEWVGRGRKERKKGDRQTQQRRSER